ncbi:Hypothetical predicted protein [Cloeon dipterum]|uniref:RING-type domain-containing protein n=1 Tax=Cloeon dipterum TaxID=197152 RepID=A0A8S1DD67_9INSE|nr:Hypothetical predicted protein [Cloeon dipterum]
MGYNINENVSTFFHTFEMESLKKKVRQLCKEKWEIEKGDHTPVPVFIMRHLCKDESLLSDQAVGLFKNEQNEDENGLFVEDGSDRMEDEQNVSLLNHREYYVNGHLHEKLNLDFALHRYFTFREDIDHGKKLKLAQSGFFYVNDGKSMQCHYCLMLLPFLHFDGCELNHDQENEGNASALRESKNSEKCHLMEGDNVLDVPILNPSNYIFESHRLYSFLSANWRNAFVSAFDLAKYGFYFTGDGDSCRCMFCKLEVRGWEPGDTANGEHRRWNPHCPFLQKGNLTGNVPIGLELTFSSHDSLSNPFVPTPIAKYGPHLKLCKNTKQNVLIEALGITPIGDMKYRQYRTLQSRENSFKLWPKQISQTPDVLCTAGFFYTGSGDRVICFQCGGGLKDWHPEDTPWSEHAKWFSSCPYLNIKKGKQFIDHIIRTNKEQESLASDRTAIESPVCGSLQCSVCKSHQASNYVNLPCGHITSCVNCVAKKTTCRTCDGKVLAYIEIFL